MAIDANTLATYLANFATYLDAGSYNSAELELLKAETVLQSLPATDIASWRGQLTNAWNMLADVRTRAEARTGTLIHAALRRKTRSTRNDGT